MFETNNKIRQEDLEELANEKIFEEFAGKTVLVTGASGLIGSEIVLGFLCADRLKKLNIKVLAMVRNEQKARDVFECVLENKNFELTASLALLVYTRSYVAFVTVTVMFCSLPV